MTSSASPSQSSATDLTYWWWPEVAPFTQYSRRLLTDRAEYGGWELDRLRLLPDGRRTVTVRRRIIRVTRTL